MERRFNMLCEKHGEIIQSLKILRDVSWRNSIKYRYDPTIGKIHDQYLEGLNAIIESEKQGGENDV